MLGSPARRSVGCRGTRCGSRRTWSPRRPPSASSACPTPPCRRAGSACAPPSSTRRFEFPSRRITVNLAPADLRKEGPSFDLPIALAFLLATGQARDGSDGRGPLAAVGELGLDGSLRPVAGALAVAQSLRARGVRGLVLPAANAGEASLVPGLEVYPASSLAEAVARIEAGGGEAAAAGRPHGAARHLTAGGRGLRRHRRPGRVVKRALEVAVAGAHNVLMEGPPGAGKTMLARRLSGHHAAAHARARPSRSPASTASPACCRRASPWWRGGPSGRRTTPSRSPGLVGGGGTPRPGEVSLAHLGVLFLDEFPEYRRPRSRGCASRSRTARSPSAAGSSRSPIRRASCWSRP